MIKLNILITALGGDIGANVLNLILQQKKSCVNIYGTDVNNQIFSSNKVRKFYKVERVDHPEYKDQILQIVKKNNIKIILPISENEIIWFSNNRVLFEELKIELIINDKNIIDTFLNKLKTSEELTKLGILTPKTLSYDKFNNQIDFPLILKSKYSISSKAIYHINSKNQLEYLSACIENQCSYIIQECVGSIDEEYTTTVYRDEHKFEVITFKRKLTGGMTSYASIQNIDILVEYSKKIADFFNLQGCINIQSRKVNNEFYVFEINPRFSSTVFIRNNFGFQDVYWWLNKTLHQNYFHVDQDKVKRSGCAVLGYQYRFFNNEDQHENR